MGQNVSLNFKASAAINKQQQNNLKLVLESAAMSKNVFGGQ